jgi:hypothetical protein
MQQTTSQTHKEIRKKRADSIVHYRAKAFVPWIFYVSKHMFLDLKIDVHSLCTLAMSDL